MFAKLSALALFLASAAAQSITAPDQASWGTVISVKFGDFNIHQLDLLLIGGNIPKTYLIQSGVQVRNRDFNFVLPYVVDQGVQYQLVATDLGHSSGYEYARSNAFTIN